MAYTTIAPADVRYTNVTPSTSLRQLAAGDVLRLRVHYVGAIKQALAFFVTAMGGMTFERYAESVGKYPKLVSDLTNGALRVVDLTQVQSDDEVSFLDVLVGTQVPPSMTVADFVGNLARDFASAEVSGVERLNRSLAADETARRRSLQEAHKDANPRDGANGGSGVSPLPSVVPTVPAGVAGFWDQFGKYSGIVIGLGALLVSAYVVRTFTKD